MARLKKKRPGSLQDASTFLYDTLPTFSRPSIGTNFNHWLVLRIGSCSDFGFFKRISFDWSRIQGFSGFEFVSDFLDFWIVGFSDAWTSVFRWIFIHQLFFGQLDFLNRVSIILNNTNIQSKGLCHKRRNAIFPMFSFYAPHRRFTIYAAGIASEYLG